MEKLKEYALEYGIELSSEQLGQFNNYYEMLIEKNKVMNLTAITDKDEVVLKHFADSIAIAKYLPEIFEKNLTVIDIGTGAGFPGIPLKIAFPQLEITLLDSLNKRILFLQDVISKLGLTGITALHGRAEDFARKSEFRENFDIAVSRAVANLSALSEYCIPFVKLKGLFIPYKSGMIDEELDAGKNAIKILGGKTECVEKLTLADTDISRSFIFIRKMNKTPKTYPRKAGTAAKNPL